MKPRANIRPPIPKRLFASRIRFEDSYLCMLKRKESVPEVSKLGRRGRNGNSATKIPVGLRNEVVPRCKYRRHR